MTIDSIAHIDSSVFAEAEFQIGNEWLIFCSDGRKVLVFDVREQEFLNLQGNPSDESVCRILQTHRWKYVR